MCCWYWKRNTISEIVRTIGRDYGVYKKEKDVRWGLGCRWRWWDGVGCGVWLKGVERDWYLAILRRYFCIIC